MSRHGFGVDLVLPHTHLPSPVEPHHLDDHVNYVKLANLKWGLPKETMQMATQLHKIIPEYVEVIK